MVTGQLSVFVIRKPGLLKEQRHSQAMVKSEAGERRLQSKKTKWRLRVGRWKL